MNCHSVILDLSDSQIMRMTEKNHRFPLFYSSLIHKKIFFQHIVHCVIILLSGLMGERQKLMLHKVLDCLGLYSALRLLS